MRARTIEIVELDFLGLEQKSGFLWRQSRNLSRKQR